MTYTETLPRTWPRTPRRCAAVLRRHLDLPDVQIRARGELIDIRWIDGPRARPVFDELRAALRKHAKWRAVRLYHPATFGAALLLPEHRQLTGWSRAQRAHRALHARDLTNEPLPPSLLAQGAMLAGIAGVRRGAVIGYHHYRWDVDMYTKLDAVGLDVLEALASHPA